MLSTSASVSSVSADTMESSRHVAAEVTAADNNNDKLQSPTAQALSHQGSDQQDNLCEMDELSPAPVSGHNSKAHKMPSYQRVALHAQKTLAVALKFRRQSLKMPWKLATDVALGDGEQSSSPRAGRRGVAARLWRPKEPNNQMYPWHEIPQQGLTCAEVLEVFESQLQDSLVPVQNPYFMGHMTTSLPAAVHEADILMSYLNQNMVKIETSGGAATIERVVLSQFHRLVFQRSDEYYQDLVTVASCNVGLMVQGGTMGNLTALTVARNHALSEVDRLGMSEALRRSGYHKAVVISSERCHYSLLKIASILGFGKDQLIKIPVDPGTQKMRLDVLEKTMEYLHTEGVLMVAVVAVAASTETGSVDDLEGVAQLCRQYQVWFHIDAAWGGAYLLSPQLAPLMTGIQQADSVVMDGHKLFGLTMGGGMVLFKDATACMAIHQSAHYVARDDSCDSGRFHLEGSRPFYALKMWMLIQRKGSVELARLVEGSHERARVFEKSLARYDCFIQTTPTETNILTYCWCPLQLQAILASDPHHPGASWLGECLDKVQDQLHALGWTRELAGFVSRTRLEIKLLGRCQTRTVLRAVPAQATTTAWHIKSLLEDQMIAAAGCFRSLLSSQIHKALSFCDTLPAHSVLYKQWQRLLVDFTDRGHMSPPSSAVASSAVHHQLS